MAPSSHASPPENRSVKFAKSNPGAKNKDADKNRTGPTQSQVCPSDYGVPVLINLIFGGPGPVFEI
jgi:hypothetical protein